VSNRLRDKLREGWKSTFNPHLKQWSLVVFFTLVFTIIGSIYGIFLYFERRSDEPPPRYQPGGVTTFELSEVDKVNSIETVTALSDDRILTLSEY
jgi:hypothetical protein